MTIKPKIILVVDDDPDIQKLLNKILTGAGFIVLIAGDPSEARRILEENPPHIIISDLHMEPEDGFSFIQSIKINKQLRHIPLLVLSALNDFSSVKKALALGVSDYVIKPLQTPMLLRKIRKALLNKDFMKWEAPPGKEINVSGEFGLSVVALGETGYSLTGTFKLSPHKDIRPEIPEFNELGLESSHQRSSAIARSHSSGTFINEVTFIGVGESAASKIRQYLNKRHGK